MEIAAINTKLYRSIASGTGFDKYFPKSSCKSTYLAKGDTKAALSEMRNLAVQYADHSKKIAQAYFSGSSIAKLIGKIHDFLYHHIQYNIDVYDQNLKSPACAWQTRSKGTDCKSFSIFASTILLNLGVKHYFRRVKQPTIYPEAYTHVYVVVPKDQETGSLRGGYYVIDATLKNNNEVAYLEKDDLFMEPKLPIYGMAAPSMGCGCGCDGNIPSMGSSAVVGFTTTGYPTITPSMGVVVTGAAAVAVGKQLLKLIPSDVYSSTLGNVIKNGFNFKCWGSSWSPSRADEEFAKAISKFQPDLDQILSITGAEQFVNAANAFLEKWTQYYIQEVTYQASGRPKDCTKKGNDKYVALMEDARSQYLNAFIQASKQSSMDVTSFTKTMQDNVGDYRGSYDYPQLRFKGMLDSIVDTVTGGNGDSNNGNLDAPTGVKKAGMSTVTMILLGGLVLGGIAYGTGAFKKDKKGKPGSKTSSKANKK